MILNGKEYAFSFTKISDAEKYTAALKHLEDGKAAIKAPASVPEYPQFLRDMCALCTGFFDILFGEGAGSEIITDTEDFTACNKAVVAFMQLAAEQNATVLAETKALAKREAPSPAPALTVAESGNREQRRSKKKKHGKRTN